MVQPVTKGSDVIELLREQYQCTEEYCNASTALYNALLLEQRTGPLYTCVGRYQESLFRLHCIVRRLEQLVSIMQEKYQDNSLIEESSFWRLWKPSVLQQHWECTRRILGTLYRSGEGTSYDRYGLPNNCVDSPEAHMKLVALATLRASIQTVQESLPPTSLG